MSILTTLKDATESRHASVESCLPLLDARLSSTAYITLLQKFFAYYALLELRLLDLHGNGHTNFSKNFNKNFNYFERQKTPLLRWDLIALNQSPSSIVHSNRLTTLPDLSNRAQSWGCLYVIEGATLGGQIISKHLRSHLGLDITSGAAFFNGYGSKTGAYWKTFCAALTDYAAQYGNTDQIVLGAQQTFDTLQACLMSAPIESLELAPPVTRSSTGKPTHAALQ